MPLSEKVLEFYRKIVPLVRIGSTRPPGAFPGPEEASITWHAPCCWHSHSHNFQQRQGGEGHEITRSHQPAGNPQAPRAEPGGILDPDRGNSKRRLALRERPQHAQTRPRVAAAGSRGADRLEPGEKRRLRDHRTPEIASFRSIPEPAQGRARQAQEA